MNSVLIKTTSGQDYLSTSVTATATVELCTRLSKKIKTKSCFMRVAQKNFHFLFACAMYFPVLFYFMCQLLRCTANSTSISCNNKFSIHPTKNKKQQTENLAAAMKFTWQRIKKKQNSVSSSTSIL